MTEKLILARKPSGLLVPKLRPKPVYIVKDGKVMMRKMVKKKPVKHDGP